MNTRGHAVLIVTWALACAFSMCVLSVSLCALFSIAVEKEVLTWLKEVSLMCGAALTGLIARTSNNEPLIPPAVLPPEVKVINDKKEPIPTEPQQPTTSP